MVHFYPRWLCTVLAVFTALNTHMAFAALTHGGITDFSNGLALDTFALKNLINDIVHESNPGALQDVSEQYNHLIDTLAAQFYFLPGTPAVQDPGSQQTMFKAYSNFVQSLLELSDALIAGAESLVDLDARNYFTIPAAEATLESVFDAYAFNLIALYDHGNHIHDQMVVQKSRVDASVLQANAAIHSTREGLAPVPSSNSFSGTSTTAGSSATGVAPNSTFSRPTLAGS